MIKQYGDVLLDVTDIIAIQIFSDKAIGSMFRFFLRNSTSIDKKGVEGRNIMDDFSTFHNMQLPKDINLSSFVEISKKQVDNKVREKIQNKDNISKKEDSNKITPESKEYASGDHTKVFQDLVDNMTKNFHEMVISQQGSMSSLVDTVIEKLNAVKDAPSNDSVPKIPLHEDWRIMGIEVTDRDNNGNIKRIEMRKEA